MLVLIAIIYLAFISLGLPDSLMGSAWPAMHKALGVPISYMGIVSTVVIICTIISGLFSDRIIKRFGTGTVTAVSVLLSAIGLFGYSITNSLPMLCVWAIPYGLGAGSIDAALNNYAALNLKSRHMSWLHCFWGVGTIIGPYIMGSCLSSSGYWQGGYRIVSLIQASIAALMFICIPLWRKCAKTETPAPKAKSSYGITDTLKIRGVPLVLLTFFSYSALEATTGAWASSYLCESKGLSEGVSAKFAALYFLGITFGRFISGFVSDKLGDKKLIRIGFIGIITGIILLFIPTESDLPALFGLVITGIGCAPIYPSLIHSVPIDFGADKSQSIIGTVMACACGGAAIMPPLFGIIANMTSLIYFPVYIMVFGLVTAILFEIYVRHL
ncbi:MAG: MFS transporter [Oscillospiraceae bacterium]